MSNETGITRSGACEQEDAEAVLRHAFHGQPLDPEVARRVQERGARVSEEIRSVHGVIDDEAFEALLSDDDGVCMGREALPCPRKAVGMAPGEK